MRFPEELAITNADGAVDNQDEIGAAAGPHPSCFA
jgi:hypothetical protein